MHMYLPRKAAAQALSAWNPSISRSVSDLLRIQICSELDLYHVLGLPAATRRSLNREDAHVGILAIGRSPGALSVRDPAPPSIATDPRRNRRAARCGACLASMEELWPG